MKNLTRIMTVIGLFSISQLAYAASIPDTYTTGDTLTAEKLTTIKNAVNDNDTRVTTNASGISANTSSINAIDSLPAATGLVPWIKTPSLYRCDGVPTWSTSGCKVYTVGDIGPGGGIVFYVINGGRSGLEVLRHDLGCEDFVPGASDATGCPYDPGDGVFVDGDLNEFTTAFRWGFHGCNLSVNFDHTFGEGLGDGLANTKALVEGINRCRALFSLGELGVRFTPYAAEAVTQLISGGYADWFIPTQAAMGEMYDTIGPGTLANLPNRLRPSSKTGGGEGHYWSSIPVANNANETLCMELSDRATNPHSRLSYLRVRPVRAF